MPRRRRQNCCELVLLRRGIPVAIVRRSNRQRRRAPRNYSVTWNRYAPRQIRRCAFNPEGEVREEKQLEVMIITIRLGFSFADNAINPPLIKRCSRPGEIREKKGEGAKGGGGRWVEFREIFRWTRRNCSGVQENRRPIKRKVSSLRESLFRNGFSHPSFPAKWNEKKWNFASRFPVFFINERWFGKFLKAVSSFVILFH